MCTFAYTGKLVIQEVIDGTSEQVWWQGSTIKMIYSEIGKKIRYNRKPHESACRGPRSCLIRQYRTYSNGCWHHLSYY
jgi:hypothetical protein